MGSEGTLGIITKVTLKLQPMPPYRFDLLAVFDDPFKALDVVPKIMQAGLNPTSMEYMDNSYVRACADYIEFKGAPHYEDGIYVIITVETFSEDELDMKMEQLDELCEAAGAVEVLEADDRIWAMRRNCQESISLVSKVSLTDDVVVPVDRIAPTIKEIMHIGSKYPFPIPVKSMRISVTAICISFSANAIWMMQPGKKSCMTSMKKFMPMLTLRAAA